MATTKSWPGGSSNVTTQTYNIPQTGNVNWGALSNFLIALADGAQSTTFQKYAVRNATTTPITVVAATDCVVVVDLAVAGASTVNLPAGSNKQIIYVVDGKGDANDNNITVVPNGVETIAGAADYVLTAARQTIMLAFNAADSDWKLVGVSNAPGSEIGGFTSDRAMESSASGLLQASATTSTELSYLIGTTSSVQTQLNSLSSAISGKMSSFLASGDIFVGDGSNVATGVTMTGDVSLDNAGVSTITAGAITNAKVSASAAIAFSKLAALPDGQVLIGSPANIATAQAVTGDITMDSSGVTSISAGAIVNADISASAAISYSKLATLTAGNIVLGNGSNVATSTAVTGDVTINSSGVTAIGAGVIVDSDINASAAISWSKLATMTSANILVGNGSNVATVVPMSGVIAMSNTGATSYASGAFGSLNISTTGTLTSGNATITGFTNGSSAAAGIIGEVLAGTLVRSSQTALTTGTAKTITSVTLTAGDWDIWGLVCFSPAALTSITQLQAAISTANNTMPGVATRAVQNSSGEIIVISSFPAQVPNDDLSLQTLYSYVRISGSVTLYLVAQATFTAAALGGYGSITARRRR